MIILSVDIGGTDGTGVVIYNSEFEKIVLSETFTSRDKEFGVVDFFHQVSSYCYRYAPELMLVPIPTAHFSTNKRHHQKIGTLMVIADELSIKMKMLVDSNCKKIVFGEGNGAADKEFIAKAFIKQKKLKTEHERDAYMFIKAFESGDLLLQDN